MAQEPQEWTKATRRTQGGGGLHLYIDADTLKDAFDYAGIDYFENELEIKRYPMKDKKGIAKIILKIRRKK